MVDRPKLSHAMVDDGRLGLIRLNPLLSKADGVRFKFVAWELIGIGGTALK